MFNKTEKRRFYDRDPLLKEMTVTLKSLEDTELQSIISRASVAYMYKHPVLKPLLKDVRHISMKKIMGLKNAQRGTRWYDKDPNLQKLFMNLYLLEVEHQRLMAKKLLDVLQIVRLYQLHCVAMAAPLKPDLIAKLIQDYFDQPTPDATVLFTHRLFTFLTSKVASVIELAVDPTAMMEPVAVHGHRRVFTRLKRRRADREPFCNEMLEGFKTLAPDHQKVVAGELLQNAAFSDPSQFEVQSMRAVDAKRHIANLVYPPKRRWYDQSALLQQFYLSYFLLPIHLQRQLAKSTLMFFDLLKSYNHQCQFLGESERADVMKTMAKTYFALDDGDKAYRYVQSLKRRFSQNISQSETEYQTMLVALQSPQGTIKKTISHSDGPDTPRKNHPEDLAEEQVGMKIRETIRQE